MMSFQRPNSHPLTQQDPNLKNEKKCDLVEEQHFLREAVIGRGAYSCVTSAIHTVSGKKVALKEIPLQFFRTHALREQLKCEINLHRALRHPHIARMYTYFFTPSNVVIVMELCRETIRDRLERQGKFDELRACRYTRQTARAIQCLHQSRIAHRDIKLENILLDKDGVVKLTDFGWSREENDGRRTVCGTLDYLSPEMLTGAKHNGKTDVWSLGIAVVEMITGVTPFFHASEKHTLDAIKRDEPQNFDQLSPCAQDLVRRMLEKDPEKRASIDDVLAHPWTSMDKQQRETSV